MFRHLSGHLLPEALLFQTDNPDASHDEIMDGIMDLMGNVSSHSCGCGNDGCIFLGLAAPNAPKEPWSVRLDLKWGSFELIKHYNIESTYVDKERLWELHHRYKIDETGMTVPVQTCRGHTGHSICLQTTVDTKQQHDKENCWICQASNDTVMREQRDNDRAVRISAYMKKLWTEVKHRQTIMQRFNNDRKQFLEKANVKELYDVLILVAKLTGTKIPKNDLKQTLISCERRKTIMRKKLTEIDKTFDWEKFITVAKEETMDNEYGNAFRAQNVGSDST